MLSIWLVNTIDLVGECYQIGLLHYKILFVTIETERRNTMQDILFIFKKHSKDIIIFALILLCLLLTIYSIFKDDHSLDTVNTDLITNEDEIEEDKEEKPIAYYVDIKGAVENPGVYEVKEGAIISDVIAQAGGLKENAYEEGINLSKKVSDEMVIYIYTDSEVEESIAKNPPTSNSDKKTSDSTCHSTSYDITDCITLTESLIIPGNEQNNTNGNLEENRIININTATKEQLDSLSGIGEVKAQAIIDYRSVNGNFTKIEDILNVDGIGDALFAKIKDFITV